jgi:hypothetical protein
VTVTATARDGSGRQAQAIVTLVPPAPPVTPDGRLSVQGVEAAPGEIAEVTVRADALETGWEEITLTLQFDPRLSLERSDIEAGPGSLPQRKRAARSRCDGRASPRPRRGGNA